MINIWKYGNVAEGINASYPNRQGDAWQRVESEGTFGVIHGDKSGGSSSDTETIICAESKSIQQGSDCCRRRSLVIRNYDSGC